MNQNIQDTLFHLFNQVINDPETLLDVPIDAYPEETDERRLLSSFRQMLEALRQGYQDALRSKEAQYRAIFEATSDALIINDAEGFCTEANPAACSLYGFTHEEFIGKHFTECMHPDIHPFIAPYIQKVLNGESAQTQAIGVRKDGSLFYGEAHSTPFTYHGKLQVLSAIRDVTQHRQAMAQLREKEEQYRSIFEATSDALMVNDLEGFVIEANSAACKLLGYSREEFVGMHYTAFIPPELHPFVAKYLRKVLTGKQLQTTTIGVRKDGSTFDVETQGTPFTYQGQLHVLSAFRDITERKQAEQQLREKEEQYRGIFEATSDGLFITDPDDGHLVEVNPAAHLMHGYSYEEFINMHPTAFIHPDSHPIFAEYIRTVKSGGQFYAQAIDIRKDGSTFPIEVHGTQFTYKGKVHVLGIVRDITERKQAEEQLREKEEQYRSIFEASIDGVFIQDIEDGRVVEVNPAGCKMHGLTYEEFIGLLPSSFIHPDSAALVADTLTTIKTSSHYHGLGFAMRKDGSPFPADAHMTRFMYKGKPHLLSVVRDVTEQLQAEQQLREKEEEYRSIFEGTIDGLIINDLEDGHIVEVNAAVCKMYGYPYDDFLNLQTGDILHPDYQHVFAEYIRTVRRGEIFQGRAVVVHKNGSLVHIDIHGTAFMYRGKVHALSAVRDISEQVRAEEQLREKEGQYRSIFEASSDGLVINDLEDGHLVEANPAMCRMHGYSCEEFMNLHPTSFIHPDSLPIFMEYLETVKAGREFQATAIDVRKDGTPFPVEVHGTTFTYKGKPHVLAVVRDITEQEQAYQLLEQRVEERTHELSTLLEVSHNVAATIELKPLLGLVLDQLKVVADYTGSSFSIVEGENLILVDNRGPAPLEQVLQLRLPIKGMGLIWEMFCRQEPVIIADVHGDEPLAQAFRVWMKERMKTTFGYIRSWMGIPLTLKEQVIGMLTLSSHEPDFYTSQHARMAMAIASQAAVAIENARLYEQAQDLAAIQERQRLARELHDSVSQALYGISLGTHTARTLLDRDPGKVAEPLDYVLSLADAALVEMRALIFELRPESLEAEGLVTALHKQAAALQARHGIEVSTQLCEEPDAPLKVKKELYRVAQEALHNTVKHAQASKVELHLESSEEGIFLEIRDNGIGFDPQASFPGHLGLHSMRERVTGLGGILQLKSAPGQGTCISVWLPVESIAKRRTGMLS